MKDIILIICCIILYGSGTFFKRLGLIYFHPYQLLLLTGICYFLFAPLWYYLAGTQPNITYNSAPGLAYVILYALSSISAGLILAFLLRSTNNPGTFIVMTNLSSFITLFLCFMFLNEQLTLAKIIAAILAILSLILINF